jgi:hypothetical protein
MPKGWAGPLRWTVTTSDLLLISTILTKYVALRVEGPIIVHVPVKSRQGVPQGIKYHWHQRAESNTEGLGPPRWTVTTSIARIDHSDQICCAAGQGRVTHLVRIVVI